MTVGFSIIGTLVVDDSEDERELLRCQLRPVASVRIVGFVHDGIEAIDYLRGVDQFADRQKFPYPELMLLDFQMPRCNGMQVLELMGRQRHRPRVVLWSNVLEQIDVPLALHLGADLVCSKPDSARELAEVIHRVEASVFKTGVPFAPWEYARHGFSRARPSFPSQPCRRIA